MTAALRVNPGTAESSARAADAPAVAMTVKAVAAPQPAAAKAEPTAAVVPSAAVRAVDTKPPMVAAAAPAHDNAFGDAFGSLPDAPLPVSAPPVKEHAPVGSTHDEWDVLPSTATTSAVAPVTASAAAADDDWGMPSAAAAASVPTDGFAPLDDAFAVADAAIPSSNSAMIPSVGDFTKQSPAPASVGDAFAAFPIDSGSANAVAGDAFSGFDAFGDADSAAVPGAAVAADDWASAATFASPAPAATGAAGTDEWGF